MSLYCKRILFICICSLLQITGFTQSCVDDYFQSNYTTPTVHFFSSNVLTSQNEILCAGTTLRYRSILKDGWVCKFSPQGTVLLSKHYTSSDFNFIQFNKAIPADGDNIFVTGNIGNVDTSTFPLPTPLTQYGVILKLDKYGNIIWTKMFGKMFVSNLSSQIDDIIPLANGDYAFTLSYSSDNSVNIMVCIDRNGTLKWTNTFSPIPTKYIAFFGQGKLKQLKNGNIVLAQQLTLLNLDNPYFTPPKQGYYIANINSTYGNRLWDKSFFFTLPPNNRQRTFDPVAGITELPDGNLSLISSFADTSYIYFRTATNVLNILLDSIGHTKAILQYKNNAPPISASHVTDVGTNGDQVILMDNADAPYLMRINKDGDIQWTKSYPGTGRSQETKAVLSTLYGLYFFSFTHNGGSTDLRLVKTDSSGNADCIDAPLSIAASNIKNLFKSEDSTLLQNQANGLFYDVSGIGPGNYNLQQTIVCRKTCCTDVVNTAPAADLCNANQYKLPNNDVVYNSGTYSITYKTTKGCDSIVYYDVQFSSSPTVALGPDNCLDGKDSLVLKTAAGYNNYSWNGINTGSPAYTVTTPGIYTVAVTNACGIKKDTIQVFQQCVFTIFMPTAFSPNADGLNDTYRIPKGVNNRLIRFAIYNRWGQVIFSTANISQGWNGTVQGIPAATGTYAYSLQMISVDGKIPINQHGLLTLIR
ncbi:T9SS type B sorting domain-containing protein [Limnovirga soli]|uniref:T9SS type B sorting domain-containing protein n=1 Tax=Limnovirga soli TaxID=2656915 RepID=A0A8J8FEB5_9BACT|nr:gliding motility-associated C-terminal domain-containing protein [Limnovirga soli]NNV56516.1 T9SS type B sorting domain-containing protein [Limnovirga soli]